MSCFSLEDTTLHHEPHRPTSSPAAGEMLQKVPSRCPKPSPGRSSRHGETGLKLKPPHMVPGAKEDGQEPTVLQPNPSEQHLQSP